MPEFLSGPWAWLILGLVLIALETIAPGIFLIWLGIAALLTGVLDFLFALSWQVAFVAFAGLALASVLCGRALARRSDLGPPSLNRRGDALVGRSFTLDGPITGGEGRIRVDDSVWRVVGPELPAGSLVRVARIDGATLVVEPASG